MRRSETKILTTHVGSLPALTDDVARDLQGEVTEAVRMQREVGLDVINEGEYTKGGDWLSFIESRLGGFTEGVRPAGELPLVAQGKDRTEFAAFYQYTTERAGLFYEPKEQIRRTRPYWVCTGPITYTGQAELANEIALLKAAVGSDEAFLTTTAPASLEVYRRNEYYKTEEEYVYAIADAMAVEYRTIAEAGLLVQVDDAWLPALWDRIGMEMGIEAFRKRSWLRTEALNHALRGIPEEQVRYHLCWGSWHGPHAFDLPLSEIVDIMLAVKAQGYLIEGANARHEHEWAVWEETELPEGKILIPGVVTHSTDTIEHPELVSQRLQRFASMVGPENVIAGADCGFGGRSHPQIAWAKLRSMVQGADLATRALT